MTKKFILVTAILMFLMVGVVQASFVVQDQNVAGFNYNARIGMESDGTNHKYCEKVTTPANSVDITQLEFYIVNKQGSFAAGENIIIQFGTSCGDDSLSSNSVAYSTLPSSGAFNMTISDATVSTAASYYITWAHENLDNDEWIHIEYSRGGGGSDYGNGAGYRSLGGSFSSWTYDALFTTFSSPPAPSFGSVNMSIPEPLNGTQHNTLSLSLNTTINSSVQYNVTLYVNGLVNQTILDRAASQNKFIAFNLTWANTTEVTFNYSIFAYGNESLANATSTTNTIHIDNLRPGITFNVPTNTNSTLLKAGKILNTNITLEDTNLFSFQYNITAVINGSVVYTNSSSSLTGSTTYNVLDQVTFTDSGRYNALMRVCDGHTGSDINFTAEVIANEIVAEEVEIALDDKSDTQDIDLIEQDDRYNFEFETYASSTTKEFVVESDKYIHIIESEYEGHLITGEKWIDFETDDLKSVTITRVSDYKVLVVVEKNSATDRWDFESIGELNCRKLARGLFVFQEQALTPADNNQILSGDNTTFTLELNYNGTFMSGLAASLVYNGTSYPMTVTNTTNVSTFTRTINVLTSTNQNLSWYVDYNVSGENFSTTPRTQEVLIPVIELCPSVLSGNVQTLNFTILDEDTGVGYNDTTFDFELDYNNGDYTATLNGNSSGDYTYAFCMFPKFAEIQTDINIQFDSATSGVAARDYEDQDVSLTNTTQYINLYLLSGATEITFHVVDGEDSNLVGVLIKAYKHDLATGSIILVESESTDISGSAILNLAQSSTYYNFGLFQDGIIRINTSIGKIFLTSYDFVIKDEIANAMSEYLDVFAFLNSNLTYSNSSNIGYFNWTYTGSRNLEFCLRVTANDTVFHYSCSNSNASSLGFAVPTLNLTYTFQSSVNGSSSVIATLIVDTARTLYQIVGANTAWILILFIFLTMSLIGLVDKSIAIISGMVGLIGINMFGILPAGLGWAFTIGGVAIGAIAFYVVNRT